MSIFKRSNHMISISFLFINKLASSSKLSCLLKKIVIAYLSCLFVTKNFCKFSVSAASFEKTETQFRSYNLRSRKFQILNSNFVEYDKSLNPEKNINYLNYYYLNNYHQSVIYYNNLVLALVFLFVLFSILVLLEEDETYYNLSAISFILLITFNLMLLIVAHNLAKQLFTDQNSFYSSHYYTNYRYHRV